MRTEIKINGYLMTVMSKESLVYCSIHVLSGDETRLQV